MLEAGGGLGGAEAGEEGRGSRGVGGGGGFGEEGVAVADSYQRLNQSRLLKQVYLVLLRIRHNPEFMACLRLGIPRLSLRRVHEFIHIRWVD